MTVEQCLSNSLLVVSCLKRNKLHKEEMKGDVKLQTQMAALKIIGRTGWRVQAEFKRTGQIKRRHGIYMFLG
jgi:hypothetical protein